MMWFQPEQPMVSQHKLREQLLRLVQVVHIHLQQQLRVRIPTPYQYVRLVKLQIVLHKH